MRRETFSAVSTENITTGVRPDAAPVGTIGILTSELGRFTRFWLAVNGLKKPGPVRLIVKIGLNIAEARNQVFREAEGSWVWFQDDDQTFGTDLLMKLLARNVDVVQPVILMRQSPFGPVHMGPPTQDGLKFWRYALVDGETGLKECHALGTGGLLVRRYVWEAIEPPWFVMGSLNPEVISEDIYFSRKVKDAGFRLWCDLDHPLGHLTPVEILPRHADGKWLTVFKIHDFEVAVPAAKARFALGTHEDGTQKVIARDVPADSDRPEA